MMQLIFEIDEKNPMTKDTAEYLKRYYGEDMSLDLRALEDLQSRLMLIAGRSDTGRMEVSRFFEVNNQPILQHI